MITSLWQTAQVVDKSDPKWRPNYVPPKPGKKKKKVSVSGEPEEHDEEAAEEHEESNAVEQQSEAPAEAKKETGGGFGMGGMGGGMGMSMTTQKKEDEGPLDDPEDQVYVPLDSVEIGVYQTTYELEERLVEREFQTQEVTDYVTLGDIAAEMEELRQEKEDFEEIAGGIRLELDGLAKSTVIKGDRGHAKEQLNAAKIWQIERRLKEDPTLSISDDEKGKYPFELPDNAAAKVKKNLARTYLKIRKTTWDLPPQDQRELDDRYALLKKI